MGLTILDAGVVIGYLDGADAHHPAALKAFDDAVDRGDDLRVPTSAYAELLVGPARRGPSAVARVEEVFARLPIAVEPIDARVANAAARLRARHRGRLNLPD